MIVLVLCSINSATLQIIKKENSKENKKKNNNSDRLANSKALLLLKKTNLEKRKIYTLNKEVEIDICFMYYIKLNKISNIIILISTKIIKRVIFMRRFIIISEVVDL